jgi:hypothetical protein
MVNGRYATALSADQLKAAGVTNADTINENAGDYVVTFADGTWQFEQTYAVGSKAGTTVQGTGGYTLTGNRLKWFWGHEPGAWTESDVTVAYDGSLDFVNVDDGGDAETQLVSELFFAHWRPSVG